MVAAVRIAKEVMIAPTLKGRLPDGIDPGVPGERVSQYETARQEARARGAGPRIGTGQTRGLEDGTAARQIARQDAELAADGKTAILGLRKALQLTERQTPNGLEELRPERCGELVNPVVRFYDERGVGADGNHS